MRKILISTTLSAIICSSIFAGPFEIPEENLFVPSNVGKQVSVVFEDGEFSAKINGDVRLINPYDISGLPKNLTEEKLQTFFSNGYLELKEIGEDYSMKAHTRALGGMDRIKRAANKAVNDVKKEGPKVAVVTTATVGGYALGGPAGAVLAGQLANKEVNK